MSSPFMDLNLEKNHLTFPLISCFAKWGCKWALWGGILSQISLSLSILLFCPWQPVLINASFPPSLLWKCLYAQTYVYTYNQFHSTSLLLVKPWFLVRLHLSFSVQSRPRIFAHSELHVCSSKPLVYTRNCVLLNTPQDTSPFYS